MFRRWRWALTAVVAVAAVLGSQPAAWGTDAHHLRLISTGDRDTPAHFGGASVDGGRVLFVTRDALPGTGDTDAKDDIYERRADGGVRLLSRGDDDAFTFLQGMSADGSRVFFQTGPPPDPMWDPDATFDLYERDSAGALRLIADGEGNDSTRYAGASVNGERVFFDTAAALVPADTDDSKDVYEHRADGSLRLISTGGADTAAFFAGASADGSRVFFMTTEALSGADDGFGLDAYERRAGGELRLISAPGNFTDDHFLDTSADGDRVLFATSHVFAGTGDTTDHPDIYERRTDGSVRLITFGTETESARLVGASLDGSRVFLQTEDPIPGTDDVDRGHDVYERRADGALRLLSTGGEDAAALFVGASADGARVFFQTVERLAGTGDEDDGFDVYERHADGGLRLISTSRTGADASFAGASSDGTRAFFETTEPHPGLGDADAASDIYERRADGQLRLVSTTRGEALADFAGVSADGSRVYFETDEALPGTGDLDSGLDVYEHTWAASPSDQSDPSGSSGVVSGGGASDGGTPGAGTTDRAAPTVTIAAPRCSRRLSRRQCRRYRRSRAAWRTLHGRASDPGGLATVEVNVVRRKGRRCRVYTGRTFDRTPCPEARRKFVAARLDGAHWRLSLKHLRGGVHVLRVRAVDEAGNTSDPVRRTITLR